ncbi:TOTE conflict system archaeo-eukaryotic primase domain-containing protein [Halobacillus sp. H74]
MPKGGFGNLIALPLIALPLQQSPRKKGYSVFVNENLNHILINGRIWNL